MISILFDSNILVYAHNLDSPFYEKAKDLHEQVVLKKLEGVLTAQNLLEFYATITNPRLLANPQKPTIAYKSCLAYFEAGFKMIYPKENDFKNTLYLAEKNSIYGRKVFDIYLVATMLSNGIDAIYTGNDKDFRGFKEIKVINPFI